jgi:[ribosomal protein S18]-alanine N-acetyltransferase
MAISRVDATQIAQVRQLWQHSRHLYHNLGAEDLPTLLTNQIALMAEERGQAWGFIGLQDEARPLSMPAVAPNRAYLRALALIRGRTPSFYVGKLLAAAIPFLNPSAHGHLLIAYADADWLRMPLFQAGFTLAEEVQFLELSHLSRWQAPDDHALLSYRLRPCQVTDLSALALLDAATFTPLWHFDATALHELLMTSRLQVATVADEVVGYTALTIGDRSAHLARLAVHPQMQGKGMGKDLLKEALVYAQTQGLETILLNTQVHNGIAQQLYRSMGFRPTGRVTPVLTKRVSATRETLSQPEHRPQTAKTDSTEEPPATSANHTTMETTV